MFLNKNAFTLSEVLIALAIIGIIAAITVPIIIENHKKAEIKTKVKKDYSVIMNALRSAQSDYGVLNDNSLLFLSGETADIVTENFFKYFSNSKLCLTTSTDSLCKDTVHSVLYSAYDSKYGSLIRPSIILPDGGVLYITLSSCKCKDTEQTGASLDSSGNQIYNEDGSAKTWTSVRNSCGMIYFDVNGSKNPNKFGYDAFGIAIFTEYTGEGYWGVYGYSGLKSILAGGEPIHK